ncbi:hypothetical protein BLOT_005238 [Blomia tropicalis]|nr:hypothetical protein BLOT_005238 [Blomia tropicalis]
MIVSNWSSIIFLLFGSLFWLNDLKPKLLLRNILLSLIIGGKGGGGGGGCVGGVGKESSLEDMIQWFKKALMQLIASNRALFTGKASEYVVSYWIIFYNNFRLMGESVSEMVQIRLNAR